MSKRAQQIGYILNLHRVLKLAKTNFCRNLIIDILKKIYNLLFNNLKQKYFLKVLIISVRIFLKLKNIHKFS